MLSWISHGILWASVLCGRPSMSQSTVSGDYEDRSRFQWQSKPIIAVIRLKPKWLASFDCAPCEHSLKDSRIPCCEKVRGAFTDASSVGFRG
ncbi:hypothetical protein MPTK1_4g19260 [Marchantia polymorpha subsp. ruderalis]|uniref:Secreted protein n=2 Tax=Marchantia polymorpha TaxID=3197 RepID=A0AAF6BBI8_MARPO|nr:hypothetical protein MARPO_0169s0018 [Marchantia polymorpha]BBN09372.1 hypothetical protein Mp_4g19260 [Marchantia polymorpha subsp. ruderalis]|eukprot:PTQ28257.1 hypothetical protein MARPO_0169s0018 [Marchantia polymorpha]